MRVLVCWSSLCAQTRTFNQEQHEQAFFRTPTMSARYAGFIVLAFVAQAALALVVAPPTSAGSQQQAHLDNLLWGDAACTRAYLTALDDHVQTTAVRLAAHEVKLIRQQQEHQLKRQQTHTEDATVPPLLAREHSQYLLWLSQVQSEVR
jgi:hypothetical protein